MFTALKNLPWEKALKTAAYLAGSAFAASLYASISGWDFSNISIDTGFIAIPGAVIATGALNLLAYVIELLGKKKKEEDEKPSI
jgi:ABC-type multidrug transport system permease subunit